MSKFLTVAVNLFLVISVCFLGIGHAEITRSYDVKGTASYSQQDGVFITKVEIAEGDSATVNGYLGANLDTTVELSSDDPSDTVTFTVHFYNNSSFDYLFNKIQYESEAYDNVAISVGAGTPYPIIDANAWLTLTVTFAYTGDTVGANTVLNSIINFDFISLTGTTVKVTEGNSSDNIASITNGSILFGDTSERWTNWAPNDVGRGDATTLDIALPDAITFDRLDLYHFIDAEGCDFPERVTIEYYDEATREYVTISYTATEYFRNEQHTVSNNYVVYTMQIDKNMNGNWTSITIQSGYNGQMPMTSYDLGGAITTRNIRLTLDGKDAAGSYNGKGYYIGITEIELFRGGIQVSIE